jgi:hypothetical protein
MRPGENITSDVTDIYAYTLATLSDILTPTKSWQCPVNIHMECGKEDFTQNYNLPSEIVRVFFFVIFLSSERFIPQGEISQQSCASNSKLNYCQVLYLIIKTERPALCCRILFWGVSLLTKDALCIVLNDTFNYDNSVTPGYVEVLWGIDADRKVSVASVALVMSDLTQPRILSYVRPDITESWEFPGYVRPDITESWELSVMSDLTQPRIVGYVRPDITESWELSVMSDLTQRRILGYVRPDITESWDYAHQPTGVALLNHEGMFSMFIQFRFLFS